MCCLEIDIVNKMYAMAPFTEGFRLLREFNIKGVMNMAIENKDIQRIEDSDLDGKLINRQLGFETNGPDTHDIKMKYHSELSDDYIEFTPDQGSPVFKKVTLSEDMSSSVNNAVVASKKYVDDSIVDVDSKIPNFNGFVKPDKIDVTFNASTRTASLTNTEMQDYYVANKRFTLAPTGGVPLQATLNEGDSGIWFLFLYENGVLRFEQDWQVDKLPIMTLNRNTSVSTLTVDEEYFAVVKDFHGTAMSPETKYYVNTHTGAWIKEGLQVTFENGQINRTSGYLVNDDVAHEIGAKSNIVPVIGHMTYAKSGQEQFTAISDSNWLTNYNGYYQFIDGDTARYENGGAGCWYMYCVRPEARGNDWNDIVIPLDLTVFSADKYTNLEKSVQRIAEHYKHFMCDWKALGLVFVNNGAMEEYINIASLDLKDLLYGGIHDLTEADSESNWDILYDGEWQSVVVDPAEPRGYLRGMMAMAWKPNDPDNYGTALGGRFKIKITMPDGKHGYMDFVLNKELPWELTAPQRNADGYFVEQYSLTDSVTIVSTDQSIGTDNGVVNWVTILSEYNGADFGCGKHYLLFREPMHYDSQNKPRVQIMVESGTLIGQTQRGVENIQIPLTDETWYEGSAYLAGHNGYSYNHKMVNTNTVRALISEYVSDNQTLSEVLAEGNDGEGQSILNIDKLTGNTIELGQPTSASATLEINVEETVVVADGIQVIGTDGGAFDGVYTWRGSHYQRNDDTSKFIRQVTAIWIITSSPAPAEWTDGEYCVTSLSPISNRWLPIAGTTNELKPETKDAGDITKIGSDAIHTNGDARIDGTVEAGKVIVDDTIGITYSDAESVAVIDTNAVGDIAYSLRQSATELFTVNSDGSVSAPSCDIENITAQDDLITLAKLEDTSAGLASKSDKNFNVSDGNGGWNTSPLSLENDPDYNTLVMGNLAGDGQLPGRFKIYTAVPAHAEQPDVTITSTGIKVDRSKAPHHGYDQYSNITGDSVRTHFQYHLGTVDGTGPVQESVLSYDKLRFIHDDSDGNSARYFEKQISLDSTNEVICLENTSNEEIANSSNIKAIVTKEYVGVRQINENGNKGCCLRDDDRTKKAPIGKNAIDFSTAVEE